MSFLELPLFILTLQVFATLAYPECYHNNQTASFIGTSDYPIYPLDTDGLRGSYTGYTSNTSRDYGEFSFDLWLLTYDTQNFFLSLIAIRNPSRLWDLYKPFILWTANRNELVSENARLEFGSDGDFKLEDNGRTVWSTNTSGKNASNLCISTDLASIYLENSSYDTIWNSLDSPSNVLTLQVGIKPGFQLVSWSSETNTSFGPYRLAMETNGLVLYRNSEPYWSFMVDSTNPVGSKELFGGFCRQPDGLVSLDLHGNSSMLDQGQFLSPNFCRDSRPFRRLELLHNGQNFSYIFAKLTSRGDIAIYAWNETGRWYEAYKLSANFSCFLPSQCGSYGICSKADGECTKECPETFEYTHDQSGTPFCNSTRPALLDSCSQSFDVITMREMDYFSSNLSAFKFPATMDECRLTCETNCSCKAAFFKEGSCFHTHEDLQTLTTGNYTAFLKLAKVSLKPKDAKDERTPLKVLLPVLVSSLVLLMLMMLVIILKSRKNSEEAGSDEERDEEEVEMTLMDCMPKRFTYKQLEQITAGFKTCLGRGGFGVVYKGTLEDGAQVAVKKLVGSSQTSKDFYAEIISLARTNHLNLVKFLGFCAQGPTKRLLVYEFVPNGSLDKWIFGVEGEDFAEGTGLAWDIKLKIAVGTARGLSYLHEECAQRIIHLDLKPENVLVDVGFVPKLADFGLSRLMSRELTYLELTIIRGTPGYVAPEYQQLGAITEKSDVYSFGVLLLEVITGRRNRSFKNLHEFTESVVAGIPDKYLAAKAERMKTAAYLCLQDDQELRPSMSTVVKIMEGLVELPENPPLSNLQTFLRFRSKMNLTEFSTSGVKLSTSVTFTSTDESSSVPLLTTIVNI